MATRTFDLNVQPDDMAMTRTKRYPSDTTTAGTRHEEVIRSDSDLEEDQVTKASECDDDYNPKSGSERASPKASKSRRARWESLDLNKLREQHRKLREESAEYQETNKKLRRSLANLRKTYQDEVHQRKQLQKQLEADLRRHNDEITKLKVRSREQEHDFKDKLAQQEDDFAKAEQDLHSMIKRDTHPFMPDNIIRDELKVSISKFRDWARDWHSTDSTKESRSQVNEIMTSCTLEDDSTLRILLSRRMRVLGARANRMMVFAFLVRTIFLKFLGNPFMIMAVITGKKYSAQALYKASEAIHSVDEKKALQWRAETVRLVKTTLDLGQSETGVGHTTRLREHCQDLAVDYIQNSLLGLLRQVSPQEDRKRADELAEIVCGISRLSLELWSQQSKVRIVDVDTICVCTFERQSDMYDTYPSMALALEEDESYLNGERIQMVLSPAIQAFGNAHGENLEDSKVWCKATVLLFDDLVPDTRSPVEEQQPPAVLKVVARKRSDADILDSPPTKRSRTDSYQPSTVSRASSDRDGQTTSTRGPAVFDAEYGTANTSDRTPSREGSRESRQRGNSSIVNVAEALSSRNTSPSNKNKQQAERRTSDVTTESASFVPKPVAEVIEVNIGDDTGEKSKTQNSKFNQTRHVHRNAEGQPKVCDSKRGKVDEGRHDPNDSNWISADILVGNNQQNAQKPAQATTAGSAQEESQGTRDDTKVEPSEDCIVVSENPVGGQPVERGV